MVPGQAGPAAPRGPSGGPTPWAPLVERVFASWYPALVERVRRRMGSRDDAEDVAQEAFVRLLDARPDDPVAWLATVARRLAADRDRASRRRDRLALGVGLLPEATEVSEPAEGALIRAERIAGVRAVLRLLGERDRALLILHHDGYSYREIAARLGVSPSSVGSLLTRAHRRFLDAHDRRLDFPLSHSS